MTIGAPQSDDADGPPPEDRLLPVLDRMSEGLVVSTMEGELVFWNRAGLEMHAYSDVETALASLDTFTTVFELRPPGGDPLPLDEWPMARVIRGEDVRDVELVARRLDMAWERSLVYTGGTFFARTGASLAFLTITDISAWRSAERERDERDRRLRLAMEAAGVGTYETDATRRTMTFSPEAARLVGFPPDVPIDGAQILDRFHPAERAAAYREFQQLAEATAGAIGRGEHRWITADGDVRVLSWAARAIGGPAGAPAARRIGALTDVTAARRAERRLATQLAVSEQLADPGPIDEMIRGVLQALCDAEGFDVGTWWEVDDRAAVVRCAEVWQRSERFDPLVELSRGIVYRRGQGMAGTVWSSGEPLAFDEVPDDPAHRRTPVARLLGLRSFVAFPIVANGRVVGVVDFLGSTPIVVDRPMLDAFVAVGRQIGLVVERRRLEGELLQAQRIEALGVLSRGIAHDFNNILTAIAGNVELALGHPDLPPAVHERLTSVLAASGHARDLVDQILTFAQQQPGPRSPTSLLAIAAESVRLLRSTVPSSVEIRLVGSSDVPVVRADATQLQQVVVNLGVNAWHALPHGAGTIEVRVCALDIEDAGESPSVPPGRYAVVSVIDDGMGMDDATLEHIFDPFFTTKHPREGTGLGLSVVHGIVRAHHGHVVVDSALGEGTRVDVLIPAAPDGVLPDATATRDDRDAADAVGAADAAGDADGTAGPQPHVLFVDDEPLLADLATQMFPVLGYRVTVCGDPADAIAILEERAAQFDLVVTDMSMPKHTGLEVAAAAARARPELPVLLMSGYVSSDMAAEAERLGVREVIGKPVSIQSLGATLRRALG